MPNLMVANIQGNRIILKREQWRGKEAYISNYPGLLDEVKRYSWTYSEGRHPYLKCERLNCSLHKFVLQFLYGKDKLDEMIGKLNIIEHLDNNGLNCTYENLHILSSDMNKAKAFTIDKKNAALNSDELYDVPALITDVYYSHEKNYFQLQVFFNKPFLYIKDKGKHIEKLFFKYDNFEDLFMDWLYCFECISKETMDLFKFHTDNIYATCITPIELREDEKDSIVIERDGKYYLVLRTDPNSESLAYMKHISYEEIE